jgi:hypothetical protein
VQKQRHTWPARLAYAFVCAVVAMTTLFATIGFVATAAFAIGYAIGLGHLTIFWAGWALITMLAPVAIRASWPSAEMMEQVSL